MSIPPPPFPYRSNSIQQNRWIATKKIRISTSYHPEKCLSDGDINHMNNLNLEPRIIRVSQAHGYCGMNERIFKSSIRPYLTEIIIGPRSIGFERSELDAILNDYIAQYGRAPKRKLRAAGVTKEKETQKDVLGHENGDITSHYSIAKIRELIDAVEKIAYESGDSTPSLTLIRLVKSRKGKRESVEQ